MGVVEGSRQAKNLNGDYGEGDMGKWKKSNKNDKKKWAGEVKSEGKKKDVKKVRSIHSL